MPNLPRPTFSLAICGRVKKEIMQSLALWIDDAKIAHGDGTAATDGGEAVQWLHLKSEQ